MLGERIDVWNAALRRFLPAFKERCPAATVFLLSARQVLADILADPTAYEFAREDVGRAGGAIWREGPGTRLTTEVHACLSECLLTGLLRARDNRGRLLLLEDDVP